MLGFRRSHLASCMHAAAGDGLDGTKKEDGEDGFCLPAGTTTTTTATTIYYHSSLSKRAALLNTRKTISSLDPSFFLGLGNLLYFYLANS